MHVRYQWLEPRVRKQLFEHTGATHMVKGANTVDTRNNLVRICVAQIPEKMYGRICPAPVAKANIVGNAASLNSS